MSFLWPFMLWSLLVIPLSVALYILMLRRRRKAAVRFGSLSIVKKAMVSGPGFRRHVPPLLFLIALAAMCFALARPTATVTLPSQRGTIILAIDVSGSMRAEDIEPSRMVAAQEAARTFVEAQPDTVRMGVVAFAGDATVVQTPTDSKANVLAAIDLLALQRGTAVGSGILSSLMTILDALGTPVNLEAEDLYNPPAIIEELQARRYDPADEGTFRPALIVVLTDGQTTEGPDPLQVAQVSADLGIRIYTVGLGTPDGVVLRFRGRSFRVVLDSETLTSIAELTGGSYSEAATQEGLEEVYRNLGTTLTFDTKETEITALITAIAAAFTTLAVTLSLLWFGRIA